MSRQMGKTAAMLDVMAEELKAGRAVLVPGISATTARSFAEQLTERGIHYTQFEEIQYTPNLKFIIGWEGELYGVEQPAKRLYGFQFKSGMIK